ncbi:MAG: hypothetical protein RXR06_02560 [Thermoproteus sp.]
MIYGLGLAGIAVFKGCHSFSLLPASLEGDREVLGKSLARYGIEGPPLEALGVSEALAALGACAAGYEPDDVARRWPPGAPSSAAWPREA